MFVPNELKKRNQWVCYRTKRLDDRVQKYMISPVTGEFAKSNDPATWTNFEEARRYMLIRRMEGLAFVLSEGLVFIDIDHSIDNAGNKSKLTKDLLAELPYTYAETSCSGHGVHIICKGKLPENAMKRSDLYGLEMYDTKRFVCITGNVIDDRKEVLDYSNDIERINYKYIGRRTPKVEIKPQTSVTYSDNELINKILKSKSGPKFQSLYSGNISGYPSWSNADYAFVRILAFWTQDKSQIDSIMRSSGLYRDKWDRSLGDSTYGEITIDNALRENTKVYKNYAME